MREEVKGQVKASKDAKAPKVGEDKSYTSSRFNWNDVKDDLYRENYLGHSLKAPKTFFDSKKDSLWWMKRGDVQNENASFRVSAENNSHSRDRKRLRSQSCSKTIDNDCHSKSAKRDEKKHNNIKQSQSLRARQDVSSNQALTKVQEEKRKMKLLEAQLMSDALQKGYTLR